MHYGGMYNLGHGTVVTQDRWIKKCTNYNSDKTLKRASLNIQSINAEIFKYLSERTVIIP